MQPRPRLRQYQPRTAQAVQSVIIANRMMPHRRETPAAKPTTTDSTPAPAAPPQATNTSTASESAAGSSSTSSAPSGSNVPVRPKSKSVMVQRPAEVSVPLPGPHDSINDFTVLPVSGKKVLQSFVFARVERTDVALVKRMVMGPQLEWKRRFLRVVCTTPGSERIEIYRTERRKGEHPTIKEMVYSFPMSSLNFVQQQQLSQDEQLQFEYFDYDSKKITQEYAYGHIRMTLHFQQARGASKQQAMSIELCCTSSAERDQWVDFFVAFICKIETEELFAYTPPPMPTVTIELCPQAGVQRFTTSFLAGARDSAKSQQQKDGGESFGFGDLEPISKVERTTSALTWDVVIATTILDRKNFKVQCSSIGILTIEGLGEFAVVRAEPDPQHADVLYVEPEDPSVAEILHLYLNDDKMFELRPLQDRKKFRQWLLQCFGGSGDSGMRSFHSPQGLQWGGSRKGRSGDASSVDLQNGSFVPPTSPGLSPGSIDGEGIPFFQSNLERVRQSADPLKRARSVVLHQRKLSTVAKRAIEDPQSFQWSEMASLAYIEYNRIGCDPPAEARSTIRILALDVRNARMYVLAVPPLNSIILEFGVADVSQITGYSETFGNAGFTLHLFGLGIEVRAVPLQDEARRMWTVAFRYFWPSERILRDLSSEDVNAKFSATTSGLHLSPSAVSLIVAGSTTCRLCSEAKYGTPQCRVSGLQHGEYIEHVVQARKIYGSAIAALPMKDVRVSHEPADVLAKVQDTLRRAAVAFEAATNVMAAPI